MVVYTDCLLIGSGVAGLMAALHLAESGKKVCVCTKAEMREGSTYYAQGGISAVPYKDGKPFRDSIDDHVTDTMKAGAGLCVKSVVHQFAEGCYHDVIEPLIKYGVPFTKSRDPETYPYSLHQEGGHSAPRVFHCRDHTGLSIMESLVARTLENPNITVYEDHLAIDLITRRKLEIMESSISEEGCTLVQRHPENEDSTFTRPKNECVGAYVLDTKDNKVVAFSAASTILATGGAGRVYLYTSNPDTATGDGMAMYARLGYEVTNMEFMQFHPTCFYNPNPKSPDERRFLVTEALRGKIAGGILTLTKDSKEDFVKALGYDPVLGSSSTRDVVAKAIDTEMKRKGLPHVFLNVTPEVTGKTAEDIKTGFPMIYKHCLKFGVDITCDPIPVVPACHYTCGGIPTDTSGQTALKRLYAVGETASTGLHGANRLASNSLPEAAFYGVQAAKHIVTELQDGLQSNRGVPEWHVGLAEQSRDGVQVAFHWSEVRRLMWNLVGIARTEERLLMAKRRIGMIQKEVNRYYWNYTVDQNILELRNIACVAEIIINCALKRPESRGGHCRLDWVPPTKTVEANIAAAKKTDGSKDVLEECIPPEMVHLDIVSVPDHIEAMVLEKNPPQSKRI